MYYQQLSLKPALQPYIAASAHFLPADYHPAAITHTLPSASVHTLQADPHIAASAHFQPADHQPAVITHSHSAASAHFLPADHQPAAITHTLPSASVHTLPASPFLSSTQMRNQLYTRVMTCFQITTLSIIGMTQLMKITSHSWDVQTTYCGSSSGPSSAINTGTGSSSGTSTAISTGTGSGSGTSTDTSSGNEGFLSPLHHLGGSGESGTQTIPPPPFSTPPKLRTMKHVMNNNPGSDVASLRILTVALGRDAIFGKDKLATKSLSGRKNMGVLNPDKLIKTLIYSRVPQKSPVELEYIWTLCRTSLSKPCQMLQTKRRL